MSWLLAFLLAYVVVVGPLTFVLLRRVRRTGLAWVAVPAVAVLFTAVAFTAGNNLRSNSQAAHGSLVQASPLGDRVVSYVGLVSRDGADPTALFPDGWQVSGLDASTMESAMFDDGFGGVRPETGAVTVEGDDGRPGVRVPLSAGDFGMVTGRGRVEGTSPLAVVAEAAADGTVTGTVTNAADFDLERVIVVVAGQVADVGDLGAGAEAEWTVDTAERGQDDPWAPVERPWADATGNTGDPDPDSEVNYAVYAEEIGADIDAYAPGVAVAAGWTSGWESLVDVGSDVAGGRTGIVARAAVRAAPGTVPGAAVRREFVRGPGAVRFDPAIQIPDWGEARGAVVRFTLPDGTDPATPLVLDAGAVVAQAEVWDGQAWVPLALDADDGGGPDPGAVVDNVSPPPGADGALPPPPGAGAPGPTVVMPSSGDVEVAVPLPAPVIMDAQVGDPFGPARVAQLPADAVHNGAVYVRVAMSPEVTASMMLQVRGAA